MTPEEHLRFKAMEDQIKEIRDALTGGTGINKSKGVIERLTAIEESQENMAGQIKKIKSIAIGLAFGILIGGLMFGLVSWDSFIKWIKELK